MERAPAAIPAELAARFDASGRFAHSDYSASFTVTERSRSLAGLLKVVPLHAAVGRAERARMQRELTKQAALHNPHLVQVHGCDELAQWLCVFRDLVPGESLQHRLHRTGPLAPEQALATTAQIAVALDELHRAGLLHRDLKPSHIILTDRPEGIANVTLIDAGLSARVATSQVFELVGTPAYVSPEQASGKLMSFRSDLYSLGCVLYEMLAGKPPFEDADVDDLLRAHRERAVPLAELDLPAPIAKLLGSLLAKEPRQRPFSAQQVRRTLEPLVPDGMPEAPRARAAAVPRVGGAAAQMRPRQAPGADPTQQLNAADIEELPLPRANEPTQNIDLGDIEELALPRVDEPTQAIDLGDVELLEEQREAQNRPDPPGRSSEQSAAPRAAAAAAQATPAHEAPAESSPGGERTGGGEWQPAPSDSSPAESPGRVSEPATAERASADPRPSSRASTPAARDDEPGAEPGAAPSASSPLPRGGDSRPPPPASLPPPGVISSAPPPQPSSSPRAPSSSPAPPGSESRADDRAQAARAPAPLSPSPAAARAPAPEPGSVPPAQSGGDDRDAAGDGSVSDEAPTMMWEPGQRPESSERTVRVALPRLPAVEVDRRVVIGSAAAVALLGFFVIASSTADEPSPPAADTEQQEVDRPPAGAPGETKAQATAAHEQPAAKPAAAEATEAPKGTAEQPSGQEQAAEQAEADTEAAEAPDDTQDEPQDEQLAEAEAAQDQRQAGARDSAADEAETAATRSRQSSSKRRARRRARTARDDTSRSSPGDTGAKASQADFYRERGRAHYRARRYGEAAKDYKRATRLAPKHAGGFAGLGASRLALGDTKGAIAAYRRAVQLSPNSSGLYAALGRAYSRAGDARRARSAYRRSLELNPRNRIARTELKRLQ